MQVMRVKDDLIMGKNEVGEGHEGVNSHHYEEKKIEKNGGIQGHVRCLSYKMVGTGQW